MPDGCCCFVPTVRDALLLLFCSHSALCLIVVVVLFPQCAMLGVVMSGFRFLVLCCGAGGGGGWGGGGEWPYAKYCGATDLL